MKRSMIYICLVLVAGMAMGGISTYFVQKEKPYYYSGTITLLPKQVKEINRILEDIPYSQYREMALVFGEEAEKLHIYEGIILGTDVLDSEKEFLYFEGKRYEKAEIEEMAGWFSYGSYEAENRMTVCRVADECLRYAVGYRNYVKNILERVESLKNISIFSQERKNKIVSKGSEYFSLMDTEVEAFVPAGFEFLSGSGICDMTAVIMTLLSVWLLIFEYRRRKSPPAFAGNRFLIFFAVFFLGVIFLYALEYIAMDIVYGMGNLFMPVQSVRELEGCALKLSTGAVLVMRTFLKALGFSALFSGTCFVGLKKSYVTGGIVCVVLGVLYFAVLNVSGFDLFSLFRTEEQLSKNGYGFIVYLILMSGILIGLNTVFCVLIHRELYKDRKKEEQEYLDDIDEKYRQIRMLKHDMNNHLTAALMLINDGRVWEAKEYLESLTKANDEARVIKKTGVNVLDLLLFNKFSKAKDKGIDFRMEMNDEYEDLEVSHYELCSLFANILDNALEGADRVFEAERWISVKTMRQREMLYILCENPYLTVNREGGEYVSIKEDRKNHGMGLKQIEHIARKYNGKVEINDEDGIFRVSILMNRGVKCLK